MLCAKEVAELGRRVRLQHLGIPGARNGAQGTEWHRRQVAARTVTLVAINQRAGGRARCGGKDLAIRSTAKVHDKGGRMRHRVVKAWLRRGKARQKEMTSSLRFQVVPVKKEGGRGGGGEGAECVGRKACFAYWKRSKP